MNEQPLTLRDAMCHAADEGRKAGLPGRYYWRAVWWRLHAKESTAHSQALGYSRNQMRLYADMRRNPEHYRALRRPPGVSDWQWSGLAPYSHPPQEPRS